MDERREEAEELAALDREREDERREVVRVWTYWTDGDGLSWQEYVIGETERWSR